MPRKNRRASLESLPSPNTRPRSAPPPWAEVPGYEVRHLVGDKEYRCPGCDHAVRPGSWHLVVIPDGAADDRRHWHTECWRQELRRQGILRRGED
ncbi:MAG TPA: hypothetical protein VF907_06305 [Actinomycetota bacterium]|jgi:hypothetical protein